MTSLIIIFLGTIWESSMDVIGVKHNYDSSIWKKIANYFDKKGIKKLGNQFWDNSVAWKNKWKEGCLWQKESFFGSSTIFVMFMDGWHLVKFLWLIHIFFAIVCYSQITEFLLLDVFIYYFAFGLGHELFTRIQLFKRD
jgi:hypothetical protein